MLRSMVSNAVDKSSSVKMQILSLSRAVRRSFTIFRSAVSVLWLDVQTTNHNIKRTTDKGFRCSGNQTSYIMLLRRVDKVQAPDSLHICACTTWKCAPEQADYKHTNCSTVQTFLTLKCDCLLCVSLLFASLRLFAD